MSYNAINEIRKTLNELLFLHQLNIEFFEANAILFSRLKHLAEKNNILLDESVVIAIERLISIYNRLTGPCETITYLKSRKLPASIVDDRDPEELPEPVFGKEKRCVRISLGEKNG